MLKLSVVAISISFFLSLLAAPAEGVEPPEPTAIGQQDRWGSSPCRPPSPPGTLEQDVQCWRTIVNSTKAADFEAYLRHFRNGAFRALAVSRLNAALAQEAPNPRLEQAGCFACSANGVWRFEPTLVIPGAGRLPTGTDTPDEGEIEPFERDQLSLQVAGLDAAWRPLRWLTLGFNGGMGIGEYDDYDLVAFTGSAFVQFRQVYRIEYGLMYLRSTKPELDSTQNDRTATFIGLSFPGLSDKLKQLISR